MIFMSLGNLSLMSGVFGQVSKGPVTMTTRQMNIIITGCSVNYISGGHVSAIVLQQPHYR